MQDAEEFLEGVPEVPNDRAAISWPLTWRRGSKSVPQVLGHDGRDQVPLERDKEHRVNVPSPEVVEGLERFVNVSMLPVVKEIIEVV